MRSTSLACLTLLAAAPVALAGQTAPTTPALKRAPATITAADVQRRIHIIADDSMMGRDTPSPGLEMTAQYVADEFKRFGLKPAGENGTWFQRYTISRRKIDVAHSHVGFMAGPHHLHRTMAMAFFFMGVLILAGGARASFTRARRAARSDSCR